MNTLSITVSALAHSFSYALLYSLLQGMLVYTLMYAVLRALPALSARTRYYVAVSALGILSVWFADTWATQYHKLRGVTVYIMSAGTDAANAAAQTVAVPVNETARFDVLKDYTPGLDEYVPAIILLYCAGLAFMLLRVMVNVLQLRSLRRDGVSAPGLEWLGFVGTWQAQFDISRPVKLLLSARVNVPVMLGTFKPVILLPIATINRLSVEQVEAILLHELAHIRRHDYLVNVLQTIVETILFFNPFIWLVSALIRREREHCCDDLVVSSSSSPFHYAGALALLEEDRTNTNSLSLAATGHRSQLFHRIKRIMEMKKDNVTHSRLSVLFVALTATAFLAAMISYTPSFAQKVKEEKKVTEKRVQKTVTKDSNGKEKVVTTTTSSAGNAKNGDDVNIDISVNDDGTGARKTKVVVITDEKNGTNGKRVKHEMVISGDGDKFDKAELDRELAKAKSELEKVDWDEIKDEITKALADVEKELNIDVDKLSREIKIQVKKELENSEREIEVARREVNRSVREIDRSQREAEEVRKAADAGARRAEHRKKEVVVASAAHAKARATANDSHNEAEISRHGDQVNLIMERLHKDGLIDASGKFDVEVRDGVLYINGTKQSKEMYTKYAGDLGGRDVHIKGDRVTTDK